MAELVDAPDLGSGALCVGVRVPLGVPTKGICDEGKRKIICYSANVKTHPWIERHIISRTTSMAA